MPSFLRTRGNKILRPDDSEIFLRGLCLGGWLMQENFITGFPGTEQEFRKTLASKAGQKRASHYFNTFLCSFIREEDIVFIKSLGATVVRVPFNYRHFKTGKIRGKGRFDTKGFLHLDRVIQYCREHQLYAILDMHAVPGHQNADWHSDNYFNVSFFWQEQFYQEEFMRLWEFIAAHYRNEPAVAGYDLMNEPVLDDKDAGHILNRIYRETVKRIRRIDRHHIIFLKGNLWGQDFSGFEPPFTDNLVYSCHFYSRLAGKGLTYPKKINGKLYNRSAMEKEMDSRDWFVKKYNTPMWVGEFGAEFTAPDKTRYKINLLDDQISLFQERGYSWTLWTYKDINHMSLVHTDPSSEYMKFIAPVTRAKVRLGCDLWHSSGLEFQNLVDRVVRYAGPDFSASREKLRFEIIRGLGQVFSRSLLDRLAARISGLTEPGIKRILSSFLIRECVVRKELSRLLKEKLRQGDGA
ncbi:MAG: cellulase family glycosylhydrolase [bacterium]|nr:cellulase family glycosylhydrolase [bacterium]